MDRQQQLLLFLRVFSDSFTVTLNRPSLFLRLFSDTFYVTLNLPPTSGHPLQGSSFSVVTWQHPRLCVCELDQRVTGNGHLLTVDSSSSASSISSSFLLLHFLPSSSSSLFLVFFIFPPFFFLPFVFCSVSAVSVL